MSTPILLQQGDIRTNTTVTIPGGGDALGFAGPGTVGYGIDGNPDTLTTFSGTKTMTTGESMSDRDVTGKLVLASGATFHNGSVRKYGESFTDALVTFSAIGPNFNPEAAGYTDNEMRRSVCFGGTTWRRCDIRGLVDGIFFGADVDAGVVEDCWVHGSFKRASDPDQGGGTSHCDCLQIGRGVGHRFRRCRFDAFPWEAGETFDQWNAGAWPLASNTGGQAGQPTSSQCVIIRPIKSTNVIDDVEFDTCRFAGYTAGHLIYLGKNGAAVPTNVSFHDGVIDVRWINTARKVLGIDSGVADPTWTNMTLAANFTGPSSGTVYTAGSTISLALAKTPMSSW